MALEKKDFSISLTDSELKKKCGQRTAHKISRLQSSLDDITSDSDIEEDDCIVLNGLHAVSTPTTVHCGDVEGDAIRKMNASNENGVSVGKVKREKRKRKKTLESELQNIPLPTEIKPDTATAIKKKRTKEDVVETVKRNERKERRKEEKR